MYQTSQKRQRVNFANCKRASAILPPVTMTTKRAASSARKRYRDVDSKIPRERLVPAGFLSNSPPSDGNYRARRGDFPCHRPRVGAISNRPRPPYMAALRGKNRPGLRSHLQNRRRKLTRNDTEVVPYNSNSEHHQPLPFIFRRFPIASLCFSTASRDLQSLTYCSTIAHRPLSHLRNPTASPPICPINRTLRAKTA